LNPGHPPPDGYELLHQGAACDFLMKTKVKRELLKKATANQRSELDVVLRRFAAGEPLPSGKFNGNEGWFPSKKASNKILLQGFKADQLRAYGFRRDLHSRSTFIITAIDHTKKQDHAKPEILKAAGKEAVRVNDTFK
jgi:hypothetical protein